MNEFFKEKNLKYVVIIDAGIAIVYEKEKITSIPYYHGLDLDVFIKNASNQNLQGWVWPGPVHYVDFFHPNSS